MKKKMDIYYEKKKILARFSLLIILFSLSFVMADLAYDEATNDVYRCGDINVTGTYQLNQSINSSGASCLIIGANDITLDFAGFNITGDSYGTDDEYGLNITGYNFTTILNGEVYGFTKGVYADATYSVNISGGNYTDNGADSDGVNSSYGYNVYINNSNNFTIEHIISDNPVGGITEGRGASSVIYGILLQNSSGIVNNISGRGISTSNGITLLYSNYTIISNIYMTNWTKGIVLDFSSHNTLINISVINFTKGIYFREGSLKNTLRNISLKGGTDGIYFVSNGESQNNNITDVFMNDSITLVRIYGNNNNNNFTNLHSNSCGIPCFFVDISEGIRIADSNFSFNTSHNIYLHGGSSVILVNTSFITSGMDTGSSLTNKWYYQAYVNDSFGDAVSGANITSYNSSEDYEFSALTNNSGWIARQEITDYVNASGTTYYYSNYTIYAQKEGFITANHTYNVTDNGNNLNDYFELTPILPAESLIINLNLSTVSYGHELIWKNSVVGSFDEFGGIVTEDNIGYIASKNYSISSPGLENITAFYIRNGTVIWSTEVGSSDGTPLIDNQGDYIYINIDNSDSKNGAYKLNKTDGTILAENHFCNGSMSSNFFGSVQSMVQNDNLIFDGCMDGFFYAYNKDDLSLNWSYTVSGIVQFTTTPLYWEDTVTFGTKWTDYHFIQLNATTGEHIWNNTNLGNTWDMQPSVKEGVIYMGSQGLGVGAFNFSNGSLIWSRTDLSALSQFAIYDDRVWFGGLANRLYSLNLNDGTTNCSFGIGGDIYQGPSIVQDNDGNALVFFGGRDEYMYAINGSDCSLIWKYKTGGEIFAPPAISKGMLFFKSDDSYVYGFNIGIGNGEWNYIGYNNSGQSFCTDCLTDWQNVKADCTKVAGGNATCIITNNYEHTVNITLRYNYEADWYNASGLLTPNSTSVNISLVNGASDTITLEFFPEQDCGFFDEPNGIYVMKNNIVSNKSCFVIQADNITIDMNGYSITGDKDKGDYGVDNSIGYNHTTIKSGFIYDFREGIYSLGDYGNFINLTIQSYCDAYSFGTYKGISLVTGSNNYILDSNISIKCLLGGRVSGKIAYGISLFNSLENVIERTTLFDITADATARGIWFFNSSNNNITDSNISGGGVAINVYLEDSSYNNPFLNTSYMTEEVDSSSNLTRKWYLDASSDVSNTNITITNSTEKVIYSNLINLNIPQQMLLSYENLGGTRINYSNYTITASATGYITNVTEFNLTSNVNLAFTLVTTPTTTTEDTTSTGGGTPSYYPTETNLQEGYSKSLGRSWKVKFKIDDENHELKIDEINKINKTATITISSEVQTKELFVGEEWKVNLDSDEDYDLLIRLENVTLARANVFIMEISELVVVDVIVGDVVDDANEVVIDEENNWFLIIGEIILILILFVMAFLIVGIVWKGFGKKRGFVKQIFNNTKILFGL